MNVSPEQLRALVKTSTLAMSLEDRDEMLFDLLAVPYPTKRQQDQ